MAEIGKRFVGKGCVVTGAASGIGRATAQRLADEGGKVLIVDLNADGAQKAAEEIGGEAISAQADVSNSAEVKAAVEHALDRWGKVDVLVNDAAMMTFDPLTEVTPEEWDKVLAVNLRSVYLFCHECIPHMTGGAIVNISSVHAHETTANVVPYAASKGGIEAMVRALSQEHPIEKLRINCVAPGAVDTPMLWNNPNVKSGRETVSGAIGKPEDIAAAVAFMASDEARFVNGTTLVVDGGRLDVL